jgi:hypothetical protein
MPLDGSKLLSLYTTCKKTWVGMSAVPKVVLLALVIGVVVFVVWLRYAVFESHACWLHAVQLVTSVFAKKELHICSFWPSCMPHVDPSWWQCPARTTRLSLQLLSIFIHYHFSLFSILLWLDPKSWVPAIAGDKSNHPAEAAHSHGRWLYCFKAIAYRILNALLRIKTYIEIQKV